MSLHDLIQSGAVSSEQYGRLHVIRVSLPECETPQEFSSTRGFDDAMLLAERGVNWEPVGVQQ
jgi:hypothetical protein